MASNYCFLPNIAKDCCISCGLGTISLSTYIHTVLVKPTLITTGKGMTAVASNTCYDKATNCAEADCKFIQHKDMCMKSCGQCVEGKVQVVFYSKMWLSYIFHPDDIRRNIVTWSCHLALLEQSFMNIVRILYLITNARLVLVDIDCLFSFISNEF